MAIYNPIYGVNSNAGQNLSTMGSGGNNTANYYSSIAGPVVNNTTGQVNPGMAKDTTTTPQVNSGALWRNQILNMPAGTPQGQNPNLTGMPDWLKNQYSQMNMDNSEGGRQNLWNMPGLAMTDKNGKQVIMLDDNGQLIDSSSRALNDNFDFKTMGRYDPDLGWVTDIENTNDAPWQRHLGQSHLIAGSMLAAMGGAAALTGGVGGLAGSAADVAVPANMPALTPTTVGSLGPAAELAGGTTAATAAGTGATTFAEGGGVGSLVGDGAVANSAVNVPANLPNLASTTVGNLGPAAQLTGSALPWGNLAGSIASGIINNNNANRNTAAYNTAADRADPFGQYRTQAGRDLMALQADPSSVTKLPGYQFRLSQGEQGINRNAASTGYFRSGNRLYDISQFDSNLAGTEYQNEWNRLARMAGVDVNPGTAGQIAAGGIQSSNNMRVAGQTQLLSAIMKNGGSFFDWLNGVA